MRPFKGAGWLCALLFVATEAAPVQAAWDNVFQVCCFGCRKQASSSYYSPQPCCPQPCCPQPCCVPQQVCTTRYVQRSYYQPVTCYQSRTYYEPVTTYKTSYYYEPVTSYRYSSYYDPCTGCTQQSACPVTSYRLRSQCCPVQSWVARSAQVPVTSYQLQSYWEPVTSCSPCCTPVSYSPPCEVPAPPCNGQAQAPAPAPTVTENQQRPSPVVQENPNSNQGAPSYERYYSPPQTKEPPPASGSAYRQPGHVAPPPKVRLDKIVSVPPSNPVPAKPATLNQEPPIRLMFLGR